MGRDGADSKLCEHADCRARQLEELAYLGLQIPLKRAEVTAAIRTIDQSGTSRLAIRCRHVPRKGIVSTGVFAPLPGEAA